MPDYGVVYSVTPFLNLSYLYFMVVRICLNYCFLHTALCVICIVIWYVGFLTISFVMGTWNMCGCQFLPSERVVFVSLCGLHN